MKKVLFMAMMSIGNVAAPAAAQPTAHTYPIAVVYPDGRGETVMTLDTANIGKIWSVADGKLLQTINKKDPEWAVKLLRYKIQHPDYKESGYGYAFEFGKDSFNYAFKINGEVIMRVAAKNGELSGFTRNRATEKIAVYGSEKGNAKVWLVEPPTETSGLRLGVKKEIGTASADYFHPAFSNSGSYLYDVTTGTLINVSSGRLLRLPSDLLGSMNSEWAFNADESALSLTLKTEKMVMIDPLTGRKTGELELPKSIRREQFKLYPCSDGKSFVYAASYGSKDPSANRAWLVTEGRVIELVTSP